MPPPSVALLTQCAKYHLDTYTDPTKGYAFAAYDRAGAAGGLQPTDVLATALLEAPIRGRLVNEMFMIPAAGVAPNPYARLRIAIDALLSYPLTAGATFQTEVLAPPSPVWTLVKTAFIASDATSDIKASKVSKILHRLLPDLVPVVDSKLFRF